MGICTNDFREVPILGAPRFPGMWGAQVNAGAECLHAEVCVWFLLCHNDDVAVATMRTGASALPLRPCWTCVVTAACRETLDHGGLLGSGINHWEETAEACVASALANQRSHTGSYARCPNLWRSVDNSQLSFFSIDGGQNPTKARAHRSQGEEKGTKARWSAQSKLTRLLSHHRCWYKLIMCQRKVAESAFSTITDTSFEAGFRSSSVLAGS